jgi:hypothetical protein
MRKFLMILFSVNLIFTACKKADFDTSVTGEAVGSLALLSPGNDSVTLNPATPNAIVTFRWTPSSPGVNTPVQYRFIVANRTATDFSSANRLFVVPSDNNGAATTLTLTYKQIDDLIKASSLGNAQRADLKWTVEAYNDKEGSTLATNSNMIVFNRSANGASPFNILGPSNSNTFVINPNSTTDSLKFNWTKSNPATGSPAVQYRVNFYETSTSTTPKFNMLSNRAGVDTFRAISYKDITDSLVKYSFPGKSTLYWDITATSGSWSQKSDFRNEVSISRLISYNYPYALNVAGNYQGWSPGTAPQLVSMNNNGEYDGFIFFNNSSPEFKIVKGNDWSAGDFGGAAGVLTNGGSNITLPSAGHYRMFVNTTTMTYQATRINSWGVIGDATPGGWNTDTDMTYNAATGTWSVTLNLTAAELKFRANDDWSINFGDDGNNGSLEYGGANIRVPSAGNYTVTLDLNYGGNWSYSLKKN